MNDYLSRREIAQVDRGTSRAAPVAAVQPASASASASTRQNGRSPTDPAADGGASDSGIASNAEYAKVHARIADIMADLRSGASATSVDAAAEEIQSMIPAPTVVVPLPPASKEAVESAIRIARRLAEQAGHAHAAQANLRPGAVDQVLAVST
ncbi:hypothetical protein [Sphingobium bisphenolivorans]|uniref:hypothetical protein n=1 Tax=Sphingobium bisphenolivorans TaxID=1335760 RepID=UPI0003A54876|nr:hypothetical protein [Sphingobium bisphenolivorans]